MPQIALDPFLSNKLSYGHPNELMDHNDLLPIRKGNEIETILCILWRLVPTFKQI
jgi:hypothetical protein